MLFHFLGRAGFQNYVPWHCVQNEKDASKQVATFKENTNYFVKTGICQKIVNRR